MLYTNLEKDRIIYLVVFEQHSSRQPSSRFESHTKILLCETLEGLRGSLAAILQNRIEIHTICNAE